MRFFMRFFKALRNFIKLSLALVFALALCFFVKTAQISKLSFLPGERAYYLDSASSSSLIKTELAVWDVFRVQGESVCFTLTAEKENFAHSIVESLGGEILFTEEVCGAISYYAYIPKWGKGISINGKKINLHIAVSTDGKACKVGTPIIFGGF